MPNIDNKAPNIIPVFNFSCNSIRDNKATINIGNTYVISITNIVYFDLDKALKKNNPPRTPINTEKNKYINGILIFSFLI